MLGADPRAITDKRATPDSVVRDEDVEQLIRPLVQGVYVIPLRQGDGRRSTEKRIQSVHRTRGVAQQAIDAHAELLEGVQLLRGLEVFAIRYALLLFPNQPRFRFGKLPQEIRDVDDEIPEDREVLQWLHAEGARRVVRQERGASQLWLSVHHHSATSADSHPARPPA